MPTHQLAGDATRARSGSCSSSSHPALSAENIGSRGARCGRGPSADWPARSSSAARAGGALVLPAQGRPEGAYRCARSQSDDGLALDAERDADDAARPCSGDAGLRRCCDAGPDLLGVLLDPARVGGGVCAERRPTPRRRRRPRASTSIDLVELVPWSMARRRSQRMRHGRPRRVAAPTMPSTLRPKWSSRKEALPVGANVLSTPRMRIGHGRAWRRRRPPPRRARR